MPSWVSKPPKRARRRRRRTAVPSASSFVQLENKAIYLSRVADGISFLICNQFL
jgi:hypothetical protein